MLNVRKGDRVQVRPERDDGYVLTRVRTPPGTVTAVRGSGMDARIEVQVDGGPVIAYKPGELQVVLQEACE